LSPRVASRLESIGFEQVYDYVAGKADWGSAGFPLEGAEGSETRAGAHVRTDVPTCRPHDQLGEVGERMQKQQLTNLPVTTSDGRLAGLLLREDAERALIAVKKS